MTHEPHITSAKTQEVERLVTFINDNSVIAVANISGLPAAQLQDIRKKTSADFKTYVTKKTLARIAFEKSNKKGASELLEYIDGPFALIFSKHNPFKVYSLAKKHKSKAKAKAGMIAPKDIVVKEGDTGFPPGPVLSTLKAVGLDAIPQGGTIHIRKDKVIAEQGTTITPEIANVLGLLNIKPIEVGLNIAAAFEDGILYKENILNVNTDEIFAQFQSAYKDSLALALELGYITKDTLPMLIQKSIMQARALALEANIYTPETLPDLLAKANSWVMAVASKLPPEATGGVQVQAPSTASVPEHKEEKKEEKKEENSEEAAAAGLGALFG